MPSTITGTALYRERIALPPGAVFEATLQDIARAGAPAITIGRTAQTDPMPPIQFEIPFDAADLTAQGQYSVRATIHIDGRLRFTTDTVYPVLQTPEDTETEVHLRAVSQTDLTNTYWRIDRLQGKTADVASMIARRSPSSGLSTFNLLPAAIRDGGSRNAPNPDS